jgi:hypothetical protein
VSDALWRVVTSCDELWRVVTRCDALWRVVTARPIHQGCQIFIGPKYQSGEEYTKLPQNIPNGLKIFPMAVK